MTHIMFTSAISEVLQNKFPDEDQTIISDLIPVWAEVLKSIITRSQDDFYEQAKVLHIDLKPEIAVSLIITVRGIAEKIIEARTDGQDIKDIAPDQERDFHISEPGQLLIENTANNLVTSWLKRYQERWEPKSKKKLKNEKSPPTPKYRNVKAVTKNHFISRFFLKKYWAEDNTLTRYERNDPNDWKTTQVPLSRWGYQDNLYSDRLEDRFSLIEGDAEEPIRKILNTYPLNDPERLAFLGYLIVQKLRNPFYRRQLIESILPISTTEVGMERANNPNFQRDLYETIFENNDLYHQISHPLLWSKWVIIRTTEPLFVLPDTASILRNLNGRSILVAPLTPNACFVTSGIPESKKSVVPHGLKNDDLAKLISKSLINSCEREFVSHSSFPMPVAIDLQDHLLTRACDIIQEALRGRD